MRSHLVPLVAIITATAIFQMSNSVLTSVIPIRLSLAEIDSFETSAVATAFSLGFLIGCLRVVRVIAVIGHIRAFATFAGAAAVSTLMLEISTSPILWFGLRLLQGACLAGLFTVADSWINDRTPNEQRGRVLGIYFIVTTGALLAGQMLLTVYDVASTGIIMLVSGLFSLALIPVAATRSISPKPPELATYGALQLLKASPVAVVGCLIVGAMSAALLNMVPYYLSSHSVSAADIGMTIAVVHLARVLLQFPFGLLSDRFDRRLVILATSILIVILSIALSAIAPGEGKLYHDPAYADLRWPLRLIFASLGAFSLMLYSVCIAQAHDRTSQAARAAVTSTLLLIWSLGSIIGLLVLGMLMDALGIFALIWFVSAIAALLAGLTLVNILRRAPAEEPGQFTAIPDTSPVVSSLDVEEEQQAKPGSAQR